MQLSTKGRYSIMAMLELAQMQETQNGVRSVSLAEISEKQDISLSYLEQLFAKLRKAGLVVSSRGPGGGYKLAKETYDIKLNEITKAVEEPIIVTRCAGNANCVKGHKCNSHDLWMSLSEHIENFMQDITLAMVLARNLPNYDETKYICKKIS
jgi:Rrf2 family transcriptional regulator, iron-sulfur cluster assembly transcription factor